MNRIVMVVGPQLETESLERALEARPGPAWDRIDRFDDPAVRVLVASYATVDVDVGVPGVFVDGDAVIAFDGLLTNYEELAALTGAPAGESQVSLIARLRARYGVDMPSFLEGDFALVVHDRVSGETLAAVDPFANRMLHHGREGDRLVVASEPRACRRALGLQLRPDLATAINLIAGYPVTRSSSLYEGVAHLTAGTSVVWHRGARRERTLFTPEPSFDAKDSVRISLDRVEHALERSVRARIPSSGRVGILASGGLDSTVITALATKACRELGRPDPVLLHFSAAGHAADESVLARRLASLLGLEMHAFESREPWRPGRADTHDFAGLTSIVYGDMYRKAASLGVRVALTGEGSDDPQSATSFEAEDAMLRREWRSVARYAGLASRPLAYASWRKLARALADPLLPRSLSAARGWSRYAAKLPRWVSPQGLEMIRASIDARESFERAIDHASPHRQTVCANLAFAPGLTICSQIANGFAAELGVELRHPFLDAEVVALMLRLPTERLHAFGETKPFTRALAARLVTPDLAWRRPPTDYTAFHTESFSNPPRWRAFLSEGRLSKTGLVTDVLLDGLTDGERSLTIEEQLCVLAEDWLSTLD